ncbi:MAG: transcription elongation factor GreA [Candidatus Kerfeldbacteria bacterium RIFCSPLOWO2_01_FULL_48_11]|uniref:Transcription elongation factor GreA n=1 Tax=Candidatus Kerfeldbacteria bacterium RIFCSPLOWO2_01_FULL_48_11 TaxID=1798543 RepID=A0A1G2B1A0_9BACT|nr:MAG: transcription elongation factor GreA [Candidatus Kerfeldbacteria bacterium RIFCSPLOWO2_01_FULL_48_11]HCJ52665.1 transcription elongation factor GreA [Candidatus Kerfeldbacteria bacterium]HCM67765.1 transcription elongation factor GreA [Candidatus Kerfeldbacteria bacterium]
MDKKTYLTGEGFKKVIRELDELKNVKRKVIAERIQDAKELGDLSENAEYAEAKNEQSFTEGRIAELETIVKNAEIIDSSKLTAVSVEVGNTVKLKAEENISREFSIVGSNEADPNTGRISNESPLGQAMLGKRVGEEVVIFTPGGRISYTIESII